MFQTLRVKLFASYLLIILVCLILVGALGIFWLQRYEREAALTRARANAEVVARVLAQLPKGQGDAPAILLQRLRDEMTAFVGLLMLVDGDGVIVRSPERSTVEGERIPLPPPLAFEPTATTLPWRRWRSAAGDRFYLLYVPVARAAANPPAAYVVLATPAEDVLRPWRDWLPPLLAIGGLSLAVSLLLSYLISRSVVRPLETMTAAAEEMALGHYLHEIPVQTRDEIGRLAEAFNRMSREVERAQRTQRDLLVNISHDLQTPLTSIRGFSQAIVEGKVRDTGGLQMAEHIIYEEASRMVRLVRDLLDLARLEAGQVQMARVRVDPLRLLQASAERFSAAAVAANVTLETAAPATLPLIVGDPERLEQALGHLLDNALKYTPPGGRVDVTGMVLQSSKLAGDLAARATLPGIPANGRWLALSVADTGDGIPPEDLARIFERFYRGDKARAGKEGVGLGLTIAREIIQAHGGDIVATSQQGKGSCFYILLPIPNRSH